MHAAILAIGDELSLGEKTDTNSAWLSAQLRERSITVREHRTVSDDRAAIAAAVRDLSGANDLLFVTGGLGPTQDDLTREALGDALDPGEALVVDADAERTLRAWFAEHGRTMPEANLTQTRRPASMRLVPNSNGTAPGLTGRMAGCEIYVLPGPPREMHPMFEDAIAPGLPEPEADQHLASGLVHCFGLGESSAAERLGRLMRRDANPTVGTTASGGTVTARIRARGTADTVGALLEKNVVAVERLWAPYSYGRGSTSLAKATASLLESRGETLVTAESCTGGWLAKMIVDEPGASEHYLGGWVTYHDELKRRCLDVEAETLASEGAVSSSVVREMAIGAIVGSGADWSLAISGVAGPGAEEGQDAAARPPGLVWIGLGRGGELPTATSRCFQFVGGRSRVRELSARAALQMLRLAVIGASETPLLWEKVVEAV